MSYTTIALKRLCLQSSAVARQRALVKVSSPGLGAIARRSLSYSTNSQDDTRPLEPETYDEDATHMPRTHKFADRVSNRASLHVSGIPPQTTDEEFREAFSVLPGLIDSQLVFNSGPMRNYKDTTNRGFGFIHFESAAAAAAAAKHMDEAPIRLQGYATEIHPYRAVVPLPDQPTHVLYINGVPLDLQYLEVMELLKEKCPNYKSIRFMAGKPGAFLGVTSVAFADTASATEAKEALHNSTLGSLLLRDHNVVYGRPLYTENPTDTVMVLGTPKDDGGAYELRQQLKELDFIERYKLIKDIDTQEHRGFAIIGCKRVNDAWKVVEWFNRERPQNRVTFITNKRTYNKQQAGDEEPRRARVGRPRSRSEFGTE